MEANKILLSAIPGQIHTKPDEQSRLANLWKSLGQVIGELLALVALPACDAVLLTVALFQSPNNAFTRGTDIC